jgi:SWI/SNF related-matrix-associated actin-dependent regulator of chromatin subfamily C
MAAYNPDLHGDGPDFNQLSEPTISGHPHGLTFSGSQQTRKDPSGPQTNFPPSFDPTFLLSPRATTSASQDRQASSEPAEDGGLGGMIESLHGLTARQDVPTKKRKLTAINGQSEDEQESQKKQNPGASKGGIIAEHLRTERDGLPDKPKADPIDLTNEEDDDEVQVIENAGEEEVCLGLINSLCNAHRVPAVTPGATKSIPKSHWPAFKVTYKRVTGGNHVIDIFDATNARFAILDLKAAAALCPLLDAASVNKLRLKMYILARPRDNEIVGMRVSKSLKISITLYSPRKLAHRFGAFLSQKQLFLTNPSGFTSTPVYNPQEPRPYGAATVKRKPQHSTSSSYVTRSVEEMRREANTMFDGLAKEDVIPSMEPNTDIILTPLMDHQKQALHFMTEHEKADYDDDISTHSLWRSQPKPNGRPSWYHVITGLEVREKPSPTQGGILADMMGLGKTLSILALIAQTNTAAARFRYQRPESGLELDCNAKATLIVCPKSVLSNWEEQIAAHTKDVKVYNYHGSSRTKDTAMLSKFDIVLTSYSTAAAEFSDGNRGRRALRSINWFRIVLDEAHSIRTQNTQVSKACCDLYAERRWAVTGTPVQNSLSDLGALIKFLRIHPLDNERTWSQYIMSPFKNGDVDVIQQLQLLVGTITLRRLKETIDLTNRNEEVVRLEFSEAEKRLYKQFATTCRTHFHNITGGSNRLRGKSYAHVLKSIGRLRSICAHGREMLSEEDMKEIEGDDPSNAIVLDVGDEPGVNSEDEFITDSQAYTLFTAMQDSEMDKCQSCGAKLGKREVAQIVEADDSEEGSPDDPLEEDDGQDLLGHLTPCYHLICTGCTELHQEECARTMGPDRHHSCPHCEQFQRFGMKPLTHTGLAQFTDAKAKAANEPRAAKWDETTYSGPHTKVKALLEDLDKSQTETDELPPGEPPIRSVVFSGWTAYLDLIGYALEKKNIGFVRLDGSMSVAQRRMVMDQFKTVPAITVMLVSIKAGGQGLNFTTASKVYIMEPQFNPGVEQQAADRVHRLGQTRPVFIKHFVMKESVEEGILKLQRKKEKLAQISLDKKKSKVEENKQRMEDLKELFK